MNNYYKVIELEYDQTLEQWAEKQDGLFDRPVVLFHNDFPVPKSKWADVVLTKDSRVMACEVAMSDGDDASGVILQAIIVVVAIVAAYIFPQFSGYIYAAAAAASAAVQMIFAPKAPTFNMPTAVDHTKSIDSASPTYSVNAQNNRARIGQMIPECFGTNLQVLDLGAKQYSRFVGGEEFLQILLVVGMGEYDIHKIFVEDSILWENGEYSGNFPDVQVEILQPGESPTIFKPGVEIAVEVSGQEIINDGDSLGFFTVSPPFAEINELELSFAMSLAKQNPVKIEDNVQTGGGLSNVDLQIKVEAQQISNTDEPIGEPFVVLDRTYSYASYDTNRVTEIIPVNKGRYSVKVTRVATSWISDVDDPKNLESQIRKSFFWVGAAGFVPENRTFDEGTMIAIKARASNVLNVNTARMFKAVHTRKLPLYENGAWTEPTATNSAAAATCHILKSPYGGRLTDNYIDLETLWEIDSQLKEINYGCNGIVDSTVNVRSILGDILRSNKIILRLTSAGVSFMLDEKSDGISFTFDETNCMVGSFSYMAKMAHNVLTPDWYNIDYFDPDTGYTMQQVPCKLPDSKNAQPTNKRFYCANREQAFREGLREILALRYQFQNYTLTTGFEGFLVNFGDLIKVSNLAMNKDLRPVVGEITEVIEDFVYEIDERLDFKEDDELMIELTRKDGSLWGPVKIDSYKLYPDSSIITLNKDMAGLAGEFTPVTGFNVTRTKYNISTGLRSSEVVFVTEVNPVDETTVEIKGFMDDPRAYDVDQYEVPPRDVVDEISTTTGIKGLVVSTFWRTNSVDISMTWSPVPNTDHYIVEWSADNINWVQAGQPTGTVFNFTADTAVVFYIRVAAITTFQGPWALWSTFDASNTPAVPVPVVDSFISNVLNFSWQDIPVAIDFLVTMRKSGGTVIKTFNTAQNSSSSTVKDRYINIYVQSRNTFGVSNYGYVSASNPPLPQPDSLYMDGSTVTWSAVENATGYIVMHGDFVGFDITNALEVRDLPNNQTSSTFTDLPNGTHYFKVAAKDQFYDAAGDPEVELDWARTTLILPTP